jgi:hypothetical protein
MKFGFSTIALFYLVLLWTATTAAQTPAPAAGAAPVPYASVSELNLLLSDLQQAAQTTQVDLAKLRIEKWKTDGNTKSNTQADVESIQRNLQSALPELINQMRSSPENLPATFRLYRNLDALYDVFGSVVESAGAFGSRDEFQSLQNDLTGLQRSRRSVADRMETLSNSKEGEIANLRTQLQNAKAAEVAPPPPKKVVVDDTEPPKKTVKKKSPAKTTKPPASTSPNDNSGATTTQQPAPAPH